MEEEEEAAEQEELVLAERERLAELATSWIEEIVRIAAAPLFVELMSCCRHQRERLMKQSDQRLLESLGCVNYFFYTRIILV